MEEIIESNESIELGTQDDDGNDNVLLGKYWKDALPKLKPLDMVRVERTMELRW